MSAIVPLLADHLREKEEDSDHISVSDLHQSSPRPSSSSEGPWEAFDPNRLEQFGKTTVKKAKNFIKDFRNFIDQGNVIDLSIGIILGASFSKVVSSLVDDMLTPIIGLYLGSQLENAFYILKAPDPEKCNKSGTKACLSFKTPAQAQAYGAVTWNYGQFLQAILNFFITGAEYFCYIFVFLFFIVKIIHFILKKQLYAALKRKNKKTLQQEQDGNVSSSSDEEVLHPEKFLVRCPMCLCDVPKSARRCRYCTSKLIPGTSFNMRY